MRSFYFLCITQPTNLGDLVINKMLIEELCRYGKVYVDAYHTPEEFKKELLINPSTVDLYREKGISAKRLNLFRLFLLAKKENIHFYFSSPGPIEGGGHSIYSIVFKLIKLTFRLAGAKIISIGGCASSLVYSNAAFKSTDTDHYFMRSQTSVSYINKFCAGKASYIPDLAFLLKYYHSKDLKIEKISKKVLVSFRKIDDESSAFFEWCVSIIKLLLREGHPVVLYYQVKSDFEFMSRLYKETQSDGAFFIQKQVWYEDLAIYDDAGFVISNRLHSILIGAVLGLIPIAIIIDSKLVAKIKDVLSSSFNEVADTISFPCFTQVESLLEKMRIADKELINNKVIESAALARSAIFNLVNC